MTNLEPARNRSIVHPEVLSGRSPNARQARQTGRALAAIGQQAVVRAARVTAEGYVQAEKVHEIDHLTRDAMSGQALLAKWRDTLAGADVLLADELRFFTDMARLGKGEVIADTITTYCHE